MASRLTEKDFAIETLRDYQIYLALAERETVPAFKEVLIDLAHTSKEQFSFWARKSGARGDDVPAPSRREIFFYRMMRVCLGLTLAVKYIVGRKEERVATYKAYCVECTVDSDFHAIEAFSDRLEGIASSIEEERVKFFSNVVLGFNDALIELTGALVGFSFALRDPKIISIAGLITGISASMSMAASAYLQARHEDGRSPVKAALFTGVSYFVIALVLVLPFLISSSIGTALLSMAAIIVVLVSAISFYSAVLLGRRYIAQLGEMLLLSVGVAAIAFVIGHVLNILISG